MQTSKNPADATVIETQTIEYQSSDAPRYSYAHYASLSPDEIANVDIARLNLSCAVGLPGGENLNIEEKLSHLDQWAKHVQRETDRHLYRFNADPAEYNNSEAYFRMLMLICIVQEDFDVHYNPERIEEPDFTNSKDLLIHGLIDDDNGGTCVSMPALYVAVGRRLKYPISLAVTRAHVFVRWDDPKTGECFNIEGTNRGMNTPDDEYYFTNPQRLTKSERQNDWFVRTLKPAEELALFLMQRGHCLEDVGRPDEALIAYSLAHHLAPKSPEAFAFLWDVVRRESLAKAGPEAQEAERLKEAKAQRDEMERIRRLVEENNRRAMARALARQDDDSFDPTLMPHPHHQPIPIHPIMPGNPR